ncbi:MAG: LamG domain-containing protein [Verrucomicrobiae bacterium]|nr:LamG domain-containing protein [Verrucomicrobiae bacterium]
MILRSAIRLVAVILGVAGSGISQAQPAIGRMANGLVAYYPMHGDATEATGRGMNGMLMGSPQMATNRFGQPMQAMAFNGGMDGMMLTNLDVSTMTNMQNSVSFWMNWNGQMGSSTVSMPFGWGDADKPSCLLFDSSDGGRFGFSGGMGDVYGMGSGMMPTNSWMHIAAVFKNGASSESQLYVNGQPMAGMMSMSGMQGGMMMSGFASSMAFVGGSNGQTATAYPFFGMMSDLRMYDRALSPDEVKALYQMESGAQMRLVPGPVTGSATMEIASMMMGWMFQLQSSTDLVRWVDQGTMIMPGNGGMATMNMSVSGPAMFWRTVGQP